MIQFDDESASLSVSRHANWWRKAPLHRNPSNVAMKGGREAIQETPYQAEHRA